MSDEGAYACAIDGCDRERAKHSRRSGTRKKGRYKSSFCEAHLKRKDRYGDPRGRRCARCRRVWLDANLAPPGSGVCPACAPLTESARAAKRAARRARIAELNEQTRTEEQARAAARRREIEEARAARIKDRVENDERAKRRRGAKRPRKARSRGSGEAGSVDDRSSPC